MGCNIGCDFIIKYHPKCVKPCATADTPPLVIICSIPSCAHHMKTADNNENGFIKKKIKYI